jgi:transposase
MGRLYAAIDISMHAFQAAVLDAESGEIVESRFAATREALAVWVSEWDGKLDVVAVEATCGWRWVARKLQAAGVEVRLASRRRRSR